MVGVLSEERTSTFVFFISSYFPVFPRHQVFTALDQMQELTGVSLIYYCLACLLSKTNVPIGGRGGMGPERVRCSGFPMLHSQIQVAE